jgi:SanA protein
MSRFSGHGYFVAGKAAVIVAAALVVLSNVTISRQAAEGIYSQIEEVPYNDVGLLLGTSRYLSNGRPNPYFDNRIEAAKELYAAGKIRFIVASGDNSHRSYNEPILMREELVRNGVPEEVIVLDYAGFSTLDSVLRLHRVFGQQEFTVISQQFHNERALYIARHNSLDAIAYNADAVTGSVGLRTSVREYLARVKAVLDVHVLGTEPRFLGERIPIQPGG